MTLAPDTTIERAPSRRSQTRWRDALPQGRGLPEEEWRRRHRGLFVVLLLHVVAVPIFGLAQGYPVLHALGESAIIAVFALLALPERLGRSVRSLALSAGLLTASALLVHFSGGYIEFHFHFFVMIALLALYQHWLPFLAAIAYVLIHHGIGGALDPDAVYNHADGRAHPWKWAGIHAGFVLAAAAANVFAWRYFEEEQARRRDLLRVTEAALAQLPLGELLEEVLTRLSEILGADTTSISLWDDDGHLVIRAARGAAGDHVGQVIPESGSVAAEIATTRKPVVLNNLGAEPYAHPVHRGREVRSLASVPLLVGDTAIGILDVGRIERRGFTRSDVTLLELAADRIAPAIDRARMHDRDHSIAVMLQRRLLPKELPDLPWLQIAFRYEPAGTGVEAGGDWYDAFALPNGRVGIAMGDVVGRGTEAASLMGQLRTGLRAYAKEGHSPAASVSRLAALARDLDPENMATLFYGELDPDALTLRYVTAGHPPPLLIGADGETRYLEGGRTTPIGVGRRTVSKDAEAPLELGSTLVLYTDGLVENRKSGLEDGMRRLELIGSSREQSLDSLCEAIFKDVPPSPANDDDVAVLVVRLEPTLGDQLDLEFPAVPESARDMRRVLEGWLREVGADHIVEDVVMAANEAAANAIEHAYGPGSASFCVSAARTDGSVSVSITDSGRWRPPRGRDRGRGLMMMRALMDTVDLRREENGTTVTMQKACGGNDVSPI